MATLTFCRITGSKEDDDFRGTFAGPGRAGGEWSYLMRSPQLAAWNVKLRVVEAKDLQSLPAPYKGVVKKTPYLQLQGANNAVVEYPKNGILRENEIIDWIKKNLGALVTAGETPALDIATAGSNIQTSETSSLLSTGSADNKESSTLEAPSKGNSALVMGSMVGGGLFVAACAVAGVVAGVFFSHVDEEDEIEPLLLVNDEDGRPVTFDDLWKPAPPKKRISETNISIDPRGPFDAADPRTPAPSSNYNSNN